MRISADCIDEESNEESNSEYNELLLSQTFSRMAVNDNKTTTNTKEAINGQHVRVIYRYCSPPDDHSVERDGFLSLTVIPIVDNNFHDGYYSNWDEVKNQVLNMNFKDRNKVPKTLSFVGRIGSGNCELPLITKEDYFTALKVAELCGQPLEVMIKASLQDCENVDESDITRASTSKSVNQTQNAVESANQLNSDSENESNEDKNGFVILNPNINDSQTVDSSTQIGPDSKHSFIPKPLIETLKREITADVTKRIISKLNECLTELNIENDSSSSSDSGIQTNSNEGSVGSNDAILSPDSTTAQVIHHGIICDNCETQIKGIRYKCSVCLDYDLCEKCEVLPAIHNDDHSFLKIKQYIKPFRMPTNGEDIFVSLDVDLPTGKIINIGDLKVVSKPIPTRSSTSNTQTTEHVSGATSAEHPLADSSTNSKTSLNVAKNEAFASNGAHPFANASKKNISERKAIKIAKKLEKLKIKGQIYSNLLQANDERTSRHESKVSTSGTQNQPLSSNKTLFLSGLFVGDETIPEGTRMPPATKFRKTWKVRNTGTKVWTGRTTLRYVWGHPELEPYGKVTEVQAPQLKPGEEGKVTIRFNAPKSPVVALYQSHWRLHHRGQPFGQRLICRVVIDPVATGITQPFTGFYPKQTGIIKPTNDSKDGSNRAIKLKPPMIKSFTPATSAPEVNCVNPLVDDLRVTAAPQPIITSNNQFEELEKSSVSPKQEKIEGVKHLHEALTAVKEIRFSLDDNELIPMKANVKSHTATPANTPFDISPPKSPEPNSLSNSMTQIQSNDNNGTNNDKNEDNFLEADSNDNEEVESLSVLSLSSEGSDEFVLVPLPRCFDLNVPFTDADRVSINAVKDENSLPTDENNPNCFEVIDEQNYDDQIEDIEQNGSNVDEGIDCLDDSSPLTSVNNEFPGITVAEPENAVAIDLSTNKHFGNSERQASNEESETEVKTAKATAPQFESQPQDKPKPVSPSTNPFRDTSNETENVIHVLPESIVTGALSAAAHVYNNVSRALFPRNEGNSDSRHFAWITSPPPAAIPPPECYWDSPRGHQYQPREYFSTTSASTNSTLTTTSKNAGIVTTTCAPSSLMTNASTVEPQRSRLSEALTQLYEMGFWNQKLNQELLEKNSYDVNDTIEDLLSPERGRQRRTGGTDEVVSRQPKHHNRKGFIEEFD